MKASGTEEDNSKKRSFTNEKEEKNYVKKLKNKNEHKLLEETKELIDIDRSSKVIKNKIDQYEEIKKKKI